MIYPGEENSEIRRARVVRAARGSRMVIAACKLGCPIYVFQSIYVVMHWSPPVSVRPDFIQYEVREYFVFQAFDCYEPVMFHSRRALPRS